MKEVKSVSEYCDDNILVIPEALGGLKDVTVLHRHSGSAIFYKSLEEDLVDVEFYTKSPCVVYIERGCEVITTADNKTYTLSEDTAVVLPAGVNLHSDFVRSTDSLKAYLLFFDDKMVNEYLAVQGDNTERTVGEVFVCDLKGGTAFRLFFDSIKALHREQGACKALFDVKMLEFLHLLDMKSHGIVANLKVHSTPDSKRNIIRLMNKHAASKLSVSDLANLSGRSISSFNRDFKTVFDMPPKRWLTERRMEVAKELLEQSGSSVTDVAMQLGYENVSHFIKMFKEKHGVTPKKFIQYS